MPGILEATDALRVALRKKGVEGHVQDTFDNLVACLVLLNSSSPSVQMIHKLRTVLRRPFLPLYSACLQPALQLSSSILSTVLGKLCDAKNAGNESVRAAWDATAEVILSGILDFLDQKDGANAESDGAVWEVLYHIICEFFFLDSGRGLPAFNIQLCLSAYNTLTEIAAKQIIVRNALRQRAVLGGERLGAAISGTKDYLLLEALLILFARLLPPIHNTSQGKIRRIKFVKKVLGSQKLFKCSAELLDIMQKTSGIQWDDVAAQIVDVLARSDVTFPQPFAIDEIHVCGRVFPQPLATDRLIMDRQAFLANIVIKNNDVCESLQVPYSHIRTITLDNSKDNVPKGKVLIVVYLTSPPLVANVEMKSPDASNLHAKFQLENDALARFMEALRRRGVGKLNFLNPLTRVDRKRKSISIGSGFKFTNDSSPIPPTASFEGKVQLVNQVYKTDIEDTTTFQATLMSHVDPDNLSTPAASAVAGNTLAIRKNVGLIPPIKEGSKPIQKRALPCLSGSLTRTTRLFSDGDELSEISEFEADNKSTFERVATKVPALGSHRPKPTQHSSERVRMNENSVCTPKQITQSSGPTPKLAGRTEGAIEGSSGTRKPLLTSDSSIFGVTSSTQVDVFSNSLLNADTILTTVGAEVIDRPSVASQDFVGANTLKTSGVNKCEPSDTEPIIVRAGKLHIESSSQKDEHGQHNRRVTSFHEANQEGPSCIEITKDTSVPPKIAGSRRKRESVKSSGKSIIEVDDEHVPPRKKNRADKLGIEGDKVKSNGTSLGAIPISRVQRYTKTARGPSSGIGPTAVDSNELAEAQPTCQGTRRSSRIKKRQTGTIGGARPNVTHGKTQKAKQVVSRSASGVERRKLAITSLQDTGIEPPAVRALPFPKTNSQASLVELSSAENVTPVTNQSREMPEGDTTLTCSPNQLSVTWGNLDFVQEVASDATQLNQAQFQLKSEESIHVPRLVHDTHTVDDGVSRAHGVIEYSVPLKESRDPVEPSRPIMESTPCTETVTIDLTGDDSPVREHSELYKASVDPARSEADIQSEFRPPDLVDGIASEEPIFSQFPQHKRRSVTFASPIEYVLDKKIKSRTQVGSLRSILPFSAARSSQSPSPSGSSTLSPLGILAGTSSVGHESPGQINPRIALQDSSGIKASVHPDETADEVGIQDIVEVLNEIQAVIIKGISDKFRNVRRGIQRNRDELIQRVLDELRGMVAENAKHFNGLLSLEEGYYKNCKAIVCCWEELIDCNDDIAVQFQNVLKEHDQNISARTFPKSLLPMQPVFPRRGMNA